MKRTLSLLAVTLISALSLSAQPQAQSKAQLQNQVYMVAGAHLDSQWNWTVRTTISEYLKNTLNQNFWLFENYPDYIFNFEGATRYSWFKEYYPEQFERLKEYVKAGRWHISGSCWESNDVNVPSVESFYRNILLGQSFFQKEFGVKSTDIYLPDCFGFGCQVPAIAADCGLIGFSTQKLSWRSVLPFHENGKRWPFNVGLWQGIDGSRVMAALNCGKYVQNWVGDASDDALQSYNKGNRAEEPLAQKVAESANRTAYQYYGTGDIGGSADPLSVKAVERAIANPSAPYKIVSATSDQMYRDYTPYDRHPELPVYSGELLMDVHASGCYTSQTAMKRFNRRNEQLADAAERISVIAQTAGGYDYPAAKLTENWQRFVWHQFHDDLTGTSIPDVYVISRNDELLTQSAFADIITAAASSVATRLDTDVKGAALLLYNPSAFDRSDLVTAFVPMAAQPAGVEVASPSGAKSKAQVMDYKDGKAQILFQAAVPAMSLAVFSVTPGAKAATSKLRASGNTIENSIYKVTLNAAGDIASIVDKRYGRELVAKGGYVGYALFTNNVSNQFPAWEIQKNTLDSPTVPIDQNVKISVAYLGAAAAALKVEKSYGDSRFTQYIRLTDGAADDRIDVINDVDWKTRNALLKAQFPLTVSGRGIYDVGLGTVKRGNNGEGNFYEVYAQHWAGIEQDGYGVAIADDCKYGWDKPADNTLRLTLIHTPSTNNKRFGPYQERLDIGENKFTYSIIGYKGDYTQARIYKKAESLNNPVFAFNTAKHPGALGRSYSAGVTCTAPGVEVRAVKKAENGQDYVVRVYETSGRGVDKGALVFNGTIAAAHELNGLEEVAGPAAFAGNKLTFSTTPFHPKTFSVRLAHKNVSMPQCKQLAIAFNSKAFAPDVYGDGRQIPNFDGKGNCYSWNVLPAAGIECEGVKFSFGTLEENNVMLAKGQTIEVNNDGTYKTLYLLCSSKDVDRDATFIIDGQNYKAMVPCWTGIFGQWGWDGEKSFVKNASVAYVGTHIQNRATAGEPYVYGYMYKISIPLKPGTKSVVAPKNDNIAIFAATLSAVDSQQTTPAAEFRAL